MNTNTKNQQKNKDTLDSEIFNFLSGDLNISLKEITGKIDNYKNSLLLDQYPIQNNQKLFSKILSNTPQENKFQTKQFLYSIANFDQSKPQYNHLDDKDSIESNKYDSDSEQSIVHSIENLQQTEEKFQDTVSSELLKRIHKVKYFWRKTNPSYPFTFMKQEYDNETDEIVYSEDYSNKKVSPFD